MSVSRNFWCSVAALGLVWLSLWSPPVEAQQSLLQNVYIAENGQQVGPLTEAQVLDKIHSGALMAHTLVWMQGMPDWAPAETVPQLRAFFAPQGVTPAIRDYPKFVVGTWTTDPITGPIEGVGMATLVTSFTFEAGGTFSSAAMVDTTDQTGQPVRISTTGRGTYTISEPQSDRFRIMLQGTDVTSIEGQPNTSTPGVISLDAIVEVRDDNTIMEGGNTFRRTGQ